jgi:hypothetical protein
MDVAQETQENEPDQSYNGTGWNPRVLIFYNGEFPTKGQRIYKAGGHDRRKDMDID